MAELPKKLWTPTEQVKQKSNLQQYMDWLKMEKGLSFSNYADLWEWSIDQSAPFWESIWEYFDIKSYTPYKKVLEFEQMPDVKWFEGATLNYAEHLFKQKNEAYPAILFKSESAPLEQLSWKALESKSAKMAAHLKAKGIQAGDRVVAYLPNIPEANISFLAACSLGAIWSSCSPDFGAASVIDRFQQIEPKVLIAVDGYQYGGKAFDKKESLKEIAKALPSLEEIIWIPYLNEAAELKIDIPLSSWSVIMEGAEKQLQFEALPFDHPIWILYSSGTTGKPKAITHSHGGCLLEHYKYLAFHNDVHPGECFFWYTTTGWMMWNFLQASLLLGATIVLYDGSPVYPNKEAMWELCQEAGIHHFGTSAPFLVSCMKNGLQPGQRFDLQALRSIGSTGSPLPPEAFDYVMRAIKKDLWLVSMSGGTDMCTAFVGGNPLWPVYEGEIQARCLGAAVFAYDEYGQKLEDGVGELVITKPMPSMPIFFWNDENDIRYLISYFAMFEGIWRHGDWVKISPRSGLVIYGRSDATLNRQGIRIGTAEIYRSLNQIPELLDTLIVNLELSGGRHYMPLFVLLEEGEVLEDDLKKKIKSKLRADYSPRHVPDEIIQVKDIPYTISGKKLEAPVKKILLGIDYKEAANKDALRNPHSLEFFIDFAKGIN